MGEGSKSHDRTTSHGGMVVVLRICAGVKFVEECDICSDEPDVHL